MSDTNRRIDAMTPHAQLLALIGEVMPEMVPTRLRSHPLVSTEDGHFKWDGTPADPRAFSCWLDDAHAHIELAAWKVARMYFTQMDEDIVMSGVGGGLGITIGVIYAGGRRFLAQAPTDAEALVQVLAHIKKEMGR